MSPFSDLCLHEGVALFLFAFVMLKLLLFLILVNTKTWKSLNRKAHFPDLKFTSPTIFIENYGLCYFIFLPFLDLPVDSGA